MHASSTTETPTAIVSLSSLLSPFPIGTFIAVGVGVGVFLLFVMLIMVVIILVVVVVRWKAAYKQKSNVTMGVNLHHSNTVVMEQEMVMDEQGVVKNVNRPVSKETAPPPSATSVSHIYAIVNKSKKKGAKKEREDRSTTTNNDQCAMPMRKMGKMRDKGKGVVRSGGVEKGEQYDDIVRPTYEPKADSESGQQNEIGSN